MSMKVEENGYGKPGDKLLGMSRINDMSMKLLKTGER